jgi:ParB-like chromosome segregation protein Spo0J
MSAPKTNLLPPLEAEEYEALKASIAEHGFWPANAVVVDEAGDILDGHNRARACHELGIEYPSITLAGLSPWEKVNYAVKANVTRRQLSPAQRRGLLKRLKEEYDRELRARAAEAKRAGNAKGGKAAAKSRLNETGADSARAAAAEATQSRFDEPVVAKPKPAAPDPAPAPSADRLSTLAGMLGTSRATVARDEQVLDRIERIEEAAEEQGRADVVRLLNQPRPNLDELERAVGLRDPLPEEDDTAMRLGWVDNLAAALRNLGPSLSPEEADRLVAGAGDPAVLLVQVGQLRGAIAEAKQRLA